MRVFSSARTEDRSGSEIRAVRSGDFTVKSVGCRLTSGRILSIERPGVKIEGRGGASLATN